MKKLILGITFLLLSVSFAEGYSSKNNRQDIQVDLSESNKGIRVGRQQARFGKYNQSFGFDINPSTRISINGNKSRRNLRIKSGKSQFSIKLK